MAPRSIYGFDPEQVASMNAYLSGEIGLGGLTGQPVGPAAYPYIMGPEDADEFGTLGYQNDTLTALKKALDVGADPMYRFMLGTSPGGYTAQDFEPIAEYVPINMPGQNMLSQMRASNSPIDVAIAGAIDRVGPDPIAVEAEVMTMLDSGEYPELEAAVPGPIGRDRVGSTSFDQGAIRDRVNNLTTLLAQDDPRAAAWDGETYDPETGLPAVVTYVDSPAMEAQKRLGFQYNPYETFDPDMFHAGGAEAAQAERSELQGLYDNMDEADLVMDRIKRIQEVQNAQEAELREMGGDVGLGDSYLARDVEPLDTSNYAQTGGVKVTGKRYDYGPQKYRDRYSMENYLSKDYGPPQSIEEMLQEKGYVTEGISDTTRAPVEGPGSTSMRERRPTYSRRQRVQPNDEAAQLRSLIDRGRSEIGDARRQYRALATGTDRRRAEQLALMEQRRQQYVNELAARGMTPHNVQMQGLNRSIWGV